MSYVWTSTHRRLLSVICSGVTRWGHVHPAARFGGRHFYILFDTMTNRTQSREMQGKSRKKYKNVIEIHVTFSSFNKWIYGLFTSWARRCDSRKHSYANDRTLCNVIFCKCKFLLSYPLTANHCISKSVSRCYIIECWAAKVNVYVVFLLSFCIFYKL